MEIVTIAADKNVDVENFVRNIFLYEGFDVRKNNGCPAGIPDFTCKKDSEEYYIEVKSENDSLRVSQMEWILSNPDKVVLIFIVKRKMEASVSKERMVSGVCSACSNEFKTNDLTKHNNKILCFPCLRKNMFIETMRSKGININNIQISKLNKLQGIPELEDMLSIINNN